MLKLFISISLAQPHPQCEQNTGAISNLSGIIKNCTDDYLCDLKIGQAVSLDIDKENEYSQKYRLIKTGPKSYVAEINLEFAEVWDGDIQVTNNNKIWRGKVQSCLDKYNPYIKGPDGESLQITLSNKAPKQVVSIAERGARATSTEYAEGMACSKMLHEAFHLLGLVDEYEETEMGYVMDKSTGDVEFVTDGAEIPIYDCRAIGPEDSIMNIDEYAVEAVLPHAALPPTRKSLLAPAEFRFITKPLCESQNSKYNLCIKFAYDSSIAHPGNKCDPQAIECRKNQDWLK